MLSNLFVYSVMRYQVKILKMFKCLSSPSTLSVVMQTFKPRLFTVVKALHSVCNLFCVCYKSVCQHSDCHKGCDLWLTAETSITQTVVLSKLSFCWIS